MAKTWELVSQCLAPMQSARVQICQSICPVWSENCCPQKVTWLATIIPNRCIGWSPSSLVRDPWRHFLRACFIKCAQKCITMELCLESSFLSYSQNNFLFKNLTEKVINEFFACSYRETPSKIQVYLLTTDLYPWTWMFSSKPEFWLFSLPFK